MAFILRYIRLIVGAWVLVGMAIAAAPLGAQHINPTAESVKEDQLLKQTKRISEDELRPGDLIFWAENADDPGTIFHVAMYLGGGRMVHAPRTGKPVRIDSVYYWESPDFFGRP